VHSAGMWPVAGASVNPIMKTKHLTTAVVLLIALLGVATVLGAADVTAAAWTAPSLR